MTAKIKHHKEEIEKSPPAQNLRQKILKTTYQPALAMPKAEAGVVTPAPETHWESDLNEEHRQRCKPWTKYYKRRSQDHGSTLPEGDKYGERIRESRKVAVPKESGVSFLDSEAATEHKSGD